MRIIKLYIKSFKNLQDFTWELNPEYPVAVIVGKNASGKSNLLEAILTIFAQIRTDKVDKKFHFEVVYQDIDTNEIVFRNDEKGFTTTRNGSSIDANRVFPKQIVSYYAGISERMIRLIDGYRRRKESSQEFDIVYLQQAHFRFALLALFGSSLDRVKKGVLSDTFGIGKLENVEIKIQKPSYITSKEANIENFWLAPAHLKAFFQLLSDAMLTTSTHSNSMEFYFRAEELEEMMTSPIINNNEATLFEYLSEAFALDYIQSIDLRFKKNGVFETLTFEDLSEGEKQRIGMRGTIELFLGSETLFLLDEPDAFAHPRWQWQFVPDLQETLGDSLSSQVIFVTHSPLVLSTVRDNAFVIEEGRVMELNYLYGKDVDTVLIDAMGTGKRSEQVDIDFEKYIILIESGRGETDEAKQMRDELENIYDPNHPNFSKADMLRALYL
jgi:predicted ATPase